MDNWDASVIYQLALEQQQERVVAGEAARRVAGLGENPALRVHLAATLKRLAARLAPLPNQPIAAPTQQVAG